MLMSHSLPLAPHALRRVLVVSPHFPPTNAPDHQRIRTALPYLAAQGWSAHILAVEPDEIPHPQDPLLAQVLSADLPITRVGAIPAHYTQKIGLGNVGIRAMQFVRQAGDRLLAQEKFDLVFFSTTIFPLMALGPHWLKKFGVPYILDFQDPWRSDYYRETGLTPPGGRMKHGLSQLIAQLLEPIALQSPAHIVSVSPAYPYILQQRYPGLHSEQFTVLPFGAPEADFAILPQLNLRQSIFNPHDGLRHWVYVGRGGGDMVTAIKVLFEAIRRDRRIHRERWAEIRIHFVGTSYAPPERAEKTIEPLAKVYGLDDLIDEHPGRIAYFEAQQVLVDSEAILLIGSNDSSYTASKLYPSILAKKPILAVFNEQSSVVKILQTCQAGQVVTFGKNISEEQTIQTIQTYLSQMLCPSRSSLVQTNWEAFQAYTAQAMTQKLCQLFDQALVPQRSQSVSLEAIAPQQTFNHA